ncbi:3' terminal RNA ribose 2'-O-methyltransferase Hen1 [Kribbella sp. VKM Ac-2527]|uniref:Small RNA 2'-O-methyltransferase n=1 Tax=Kribbella caucasensis TaxID=2512215 RepID=A0A4R6JG58_9ACTN|nr:3' terminal RNA ribose 2'-O-methyltransferase Hen1 [Kribbella sp. VKM Ac-2527]TDO33525.1 3' terminal RNA ribose 2'-O-methyltransferase Hen1 [Kribbella sp. VKM Ac-2527]
MLLTIATTSAGLGAPASDLGFLLHKNPARPQSLEVAGGTAQVIYPEATEERCQVALLLEVDPIALVRSGKGRAAEGFTLGQYVNDRPYAASSLLAVALGKLFRTAMNGRCDARPELAARPIGLEIEIPALPCSGGPELADRLFGPLGWSVEARPIPLDPEIPEWGDSRYVVLRLRGALRLADALNHLYVLLPVLDDAKHYWVGSDEVDKLVRAGGGWLGAHPEKELITRRYLAHRRNLTDSALERLAEADGAVLTEDVDTEVGDDGGVVPLAVQRRAAVVDVLRELGARRVADLGCGEGSLVAELLRDGRYDEVVATDVSARALTWAERRLHVNEMSDRQRERLRLFQSSVTYADARLVGLDAAVLMEVIEHVDPPRLPALARAVFGTARPANVVVTTPNAEYNVLFESLPAGEFRHPDHRFEWTRSEFREWADGVGREHGYDVSFRAVGSDDPEVGPPTQLALFRLKEVV